MSLDRYQNLGASATKEGIHRALENAGLAAHSQYFAQVLPDIAGDPAMRSFVHADGAGTKSIVAYLRFRDGGDPKVFSALAQDALVMNLDDMYCVGEPCSLVLSNTIARNARLIPDIAIEAIISGYSALCKSLQAEGIEILLGGGETADCGDVVRTLLVDAVMSGRIAAAKLISPSSIQVGDAIVALSSTGQARYESATNSGIGSNGLTLARHCLLHGSYKEKYPECHDPGIDAQYSYVGPYHTSDTPAGLGMSVGEALASPTRTYAPVLKKIYAALGAEIHGVIHLTGGAHTKVLRFAQGKRFIKDSLFPTPPLFQLIQEHGKVEWKEMYKVFNMGQRMELYVPPASVETITKLSAEFGIEARTVGRVEAHPEGDSAASEVLLRSEHGSFSYRL